MRNFRFEGVAVASVTSFTPQGQIDTALLGDLIEWWIAEGIQGLVLCGSTGEMAYLGPDERLKLFEFGVKACKGRIPVIAGTGFPTTQATVDTTRAAAPLGVDAAIVVTPYYYPLSDAAMIAHYETVAAESTLPILLYNMPPLTGVNLSAKMVARLANIDGVVGIKDSAGDLDQLRAILAAAPDGFCTLTGSFMQLYEAQTAGASGAILAMANLIPSACVEIRKHAANGELEAARALRAEFESLQDWVKTHGIPGIKQKLNEWHHPAGWPRPPLQPLG